MVFLGDKGSLVGNAGCVQASLNKTRTLQPSI
jgi:hypothetical protein